MYVSANLPPLYGRFNQLREENYPFKHSFVSYLESISRLGLTKGLSVDKLVGLIENTLLKDNRLPDIPRGNEPVKFRFTTDNDIVIRYFEGNEISNKTAILLIIRMTLRLSEVFGTSLFRLTELIDEIDDSPVEKKETPVVEPVPVKIKKKTVPIKEPEPEPVKEEEPKPKQEEDKGSDIMSRLGALVERGDELLNNNEDGDGDDGEPASVATNPLLADFL